MMMVVSAPETNPRQGVPVNRSNALRRAAPANPTRPSESNAMPNKNKPIPPSRWKITSIIDEAPARYTVNRNASNSMPGKERHGATGSRSCKHCRRCRQRSTEQRAAQTVTTEKPDHSRFEAPRARHKAGSPTQHEKQRHDERGCNMDGGIPK